MTKEEDDVKKALIKEALQEWLDKQFTMVGKWTVKGLISMAIAGVVYLWLSSHGWHP